MKPDVCTCTPGQGNSDCRVHGTSRQTFAGQTGIVTGLLDGRLDQALPGNERGAWVTYKLVNGRLLVGTLWGTEVEALRYAIDAHERVVFVGYGKNVETVAVMA